MAWKYSSDQDTAQPFASVGLVFYNGKFYNTTLQLQILVYTRGGE